MGLTLLPISFIGRLNGLSLLAPFANRVPPKALTVAQATAGGPQLRVHCRPRSQSYSGGASIVRTHITVSSLDPRSSFGERSVDLRKKGFFPKKHRIYRADPRFL